MRVLFLYSWVSIRIYVYMRDISTRFYEIRRSDKTGFAFTLIGHEVAAREPVRVSQPGARGYRTVNNL